VLLGCSCARVADPLPPQISIPKRTVDLSLKQEGTNVRLFIPKPALNVDGSGVQKLKEIRIYRLMQKKGDQAVHPATTETEFKSRADLSAVLSMDQLPLLSQGAHIIFNYPVIQDMSLGIGPVYLWFAIEYVNRKGRSDGLSNIVGVEPHAVPSPPGEIRVEVHPDHIHLEWDQPIVNMDGSAPPCLSGYMLFRSFSNPPRFDQPLNLEPSSESYFNDPDPVFGKDIYYAIKVVGCPESGGVESALSVPFLLHPKDIFPPRIPVRLEAFGLPEGISLRWDANPEPDLAGYWLYRSEITDSMGVRLNSQPVQVNYYFDNTTEPNVTYFYRLSAVDQLGNESTATSLISCSREIRPPSRNDIPAKSPLLSLRGAKRRGNLLLYKLGDCFASLAMTNVRF